MVYLFTNRCDQSKCTIGFFCGDCWNFSHFSRIFSYKSGLFYFHCSPIILCKALKIPLQSEMTFQPPSLPPQKNGKYFLLSSRKASHYQEHFSKWASSGINVHFSSFYILSITADSIWKVNSGFTIVQKYSDMLNMKALVGIRIAFMGKDFEWWVFWLFFIRKEFISVWSTCKIIVFWKTYRVAQGARGAGVRKN